MLKHTKYFVPLFACVATHAMDAKSSFTSPIFTYEDPMQALRLHVRLEDDKKDWVAEDIKISDIQFH